MAFGKKKKKLNQDVPTPESELTIDKVEEENEEVEEVKEEKEEHGIGMKIIDYIVKKYHGKSEIEIDGKENLFVVKVRMPAAA